MQFDAEALSVGSAKIFKRLNKQLKKALKLELKLKVSSERYYIQPCP